MKVTDLFKKYDVPAPRYTSYPTVPYWSDNPTTQDWLDSVSSGLKSAESSWSLYLHIPFCETLCTFCGCNTSITKNHKLENPYSQRLLQEIDLYLKNCPELLKRPLKSLHLGGGTPTFLSAANLKSLLQPLLSKVRRGSEFEASVEVDPRRTSQEQLETLASLGFNRVSLGVQDFDSEVQRLINRVQPFAMTKTITDQSRALGFASINFDLIYGLPKQTLDSITDMAQKTIELRPDRIALYSFALVPWIKPAQRLFKDDDVPQGQAKRELYERARDLLLNAGYQEIGMDHFALESDSLSKAHQSGKLHRNFMGYTDQKTEVMIGLGVSAIGESPTCFHQNEKILTRYEERIDALKLPTLRGHKLSKDDQTYRQQILELMCTGKVSLLDQDQVNDIKTYLAPMLADQLLILQENQLQVLPEGKPFLRNACMAFDKRLREKSPHTRIFSQAL